MTLTQEQTQRLTDNGWTIIQMPGAPVRAVHMESGSTASGLAAAIVADSFNTTSASVTAPNKGELLLLHAHVRNLVTKAQKQPLYETWSDTYDKVFSDECSGRIRVLLSELFNTELDYYDPDMDYDDDVLAFWRAFDEKIQQLSADGSFTD